MKHGSLFSGIGGFDLAAEWSGWDNMFHCEWNEFGQKILKHYWPKAISYGDITKTDFTIWRGKIDILTGGFPCQPYSTAGKRKGKADDRHLWPEMLRAIREIQPGWVVGENVRGLTNWNGGLVFDEVQADLENEGYEVLPFLLPACGVNAPHRRDRIWFVAHAPGNGHGHRHREDRCQAKEKQAAQYRKERNEVLRKWDGNDAERITTTRNASNTNSDGFKKRVQAGVDGIRESEEPLSGCESTRRNTAGHWEEFPTQSPVCPRYDGIPARLDFAAVFGSIKHPRQPARAFGRWRQESIKGAGNAIVPQVAFQIFQAIEQWGGLVEPQK